MKWNKSNECGIAASHALHMGTFELNVESFYCPHFHISFMVTTMAQLLLTFLKAMPWDTWLLDWKENDNVDMITTGQVSTFDAVPSLHENLIFHSIKIFKHFYIFWWVCLRRFVAVWIKQHWWLHVTSLLKNERACSFCWCCGQKFSTYNRSTGKIPMVSFLLKSQ